MTNLHKISKKLFKNIKKYGIIINGKKFLEEILWKL